MISLEIIRQSAIEDIKHHAEKYLEEYCDLMERNEKQNKVLAEIKELLTTCQNNFASKGAPCNECKFSKLCEENGPETQILNKINEVTNADK